MNKPIKQRIDDQSKAYRQLHEASNSLLESAPLFWTERLLLRLVRLLYGRRIEQMGEIAADVPESSLQENMLEAQVNAALAGHELDEWELLDDEGKKWQARCVNCGMTVYASDRALYSLLEEFCTGRE